MPTLKVNVVEATNLFGADFDGKSDPYCLLKIGEGNQFSCIERTRKIKNTKNPTWKEVFTLNVNNPLTENLFLEVMNKESRGKDNSLGYASMPLHDLTRGIEKQVWLQLEGGSGGSGGVLGSLVHLGKKKEKVNEGKVFLGVTALDFGLEPSTYPPGQGGMMHGVPQQGVQPSHLPGMQGSGIQQGIHPGMQQGMQQQGIQQGIQQPGIQQGMQQPGVQPGVQSNISHSGHEHTEHCEHGEHGEHEKHGDKSKHGEHGHDQQQGTIYHEPSQPIYPPQQYSPMQQQGMQQPNLQQPGLQSIPQSGGVQQHGQQQGQQTTIPQSGIQQGQYQPGMPQPGMPQPGMQYPSSGSSQQSSSNKGVYPEHL